MKRYSQVMFDPSTRSRIRESSSRNVTSRVQWHVFSTDQWPRTARANNVHVHRQAAEVITDLDALLLSLHRAATSPPRPTSGPSTAVLPGRSSGAGNCR